MNEGEFNNLYTLAGTVHRGPFADVKQVIHNVTSKRYAAKYFPQYLLRKEGSWEEAEREISILCSIRHRNVAAYHAAVKTDSQRIMIMQWSKFHQLCSVYWNGGLSINSSLR